MLRPLEPKEEDINFAIGFVENWLEFFLKGREQEVKDRISENFKLIVDGIEYYRQERYLLVQQDYAELLTKYNQLTASSAQYLGKIQELEQQNKELLVETQRDLHQE